MVTKVGPGLVHGIDVARIAATIEATHHHTSSDIRVAIARFYFWGDVRRAAQTAFNRLQMHRSPNRNGVLLFMAPRRRRFAFVGDEGLRASLTDRFWQDLATELTADLTGGDLTLGVERAIVTLAARLAAPAST